MRCTPLDNMVDISVLQELGLSKNEVSVYLALLKLGQASANDIAKHSNVHRTNVYDTLKTLSEKGLVSYTVVEKKKLFKGENPENLITMLHVKEDQLLEIIPKLQHMTVERGEMPEVNVYSGIMAFRLILEEFLGKKKEIFVYGAPAQAAKILGPFIKSFHRRRIKEKILMKHIYNQVANDRVEELNDMPYTEAKCLPSKFHSQISVNICGDDVVFMFWADMPAKHLPVIRITNITIAESFKKNFDWMWEHSTD